MEPKNSKGGQKGQAGKGVAVSMIKVNGTKQMAAYNAFKVVEWIGDFAGRGPEVKVEKIKEASDRLNF